MTSIVCRPQVAVRTQDATGTDRFRRKVKTRIGAALPKDTME
jgi:hypothetical protein